MTVLQRSLEKGRGQALCGDGGVKREREGRRRRGRRVETQSEIP